MSSRDPAPDYFLSVLFSLARNLRVIIGEPAWRNFSFKPADHLAPDEASFCGFQRLHLGLSVYLYFRYGLLFPRDNGGSGDGWRSGRGRNATQC